MYNNYNSRVEHKGSKIKRYVLLSAVILFAITLIFSSGLIIGIKIQTRKQNILSKPIDPAQKLQTLNPSLNQVHGLQEPNREDKRSGTKEPKEKSKDKDLTFYKTLMAKKRKTTVGLEPSQDPRPKTQVSSKETENLNKAYTVQVGAYKDRVVAEGVMNKMKKKGYPAYIIDKDIPQEGTIYKVRVGELYNRDKAEELARRIKEKEKIPTFVTLK